MKDFLMLVKKEMTETKSLVLHDSIQECVERYGEAKCFEYINAVKERVGRLGLDTLIFADTPHTYTVVFVPKSFKKEDVVRYLMDVSAGNVPIDKVSGFTVWVLSGGSPRDYVKGLEETINKITSF